jgi:hypothetical protein
MSMIKTKHATTTSTKINQWGPGTSKRRTNAPNEHRCWQGFLRMRKGTYMSLKIICGFPPCPANSNSFWIIPSNFHCLTLKKLSQILNHAGQILLIQAEAGTKGNKWLRSNVRQQTTTLQTSSKHNMHYAFYMWITWRRQTSYIIFNFCMLHFTTIYWTYSKHLCMDHVNQSLTWLFKIQGRIVSLPKLPW